MHHLAADSARRLGAAGAGANSGLTVAGLFGWPVSKRRPCVRVSIPLNPNVSAPLGVCVCRDETSPPGVVGLSVLVLALMITADSYGHWLWLPASGSWVPGLCGCGGAGKVWRSKWAAGGAAWGHGGVGRAAGVPRGAEAPGTEVTGWLCIARPLRRLPARVASMVGGAGRSLWKDIFASRWMRIYRAGLMARYIHINLI
jgi:hypothetical protein